jgi:hypothetical protein
MRRLIKDVLKEVIDIPDDKMQQAVDYIQKYMNTKKGQIVKSDDEDDEFTMSAQILDVIVYSIDLPHSIRIAILYRGSLSALYNLKKQITKYFSAKYVGLFDLSGDKEDWNQILVGFDNRKEKGNIIFSNFYERNTLTGY